MCQVTDYCTIGEMGRDTEAELTAKRRPGRPPGKGVVDREDLLDTALITLANSGYAGLSMRRLARELGVSLGTVQYYYRTKDELWRAAVEHFFSEGERQNPPPETTDLQSRIRNAIDGSGRYPGVLPALLRDRDDGAEERSVFVCERFAGALQLGIDVIRRRQQEGLVAAAVEPRALLLLTTLGLSTIASAPESVKELFGYDIEDPDGATALAADLAHLLGFGLYAEPT